MAKQPIISVVLPMRNASATLGECLQSIANQTFRDYEVVIVDDGSSDESVSMVKEWRRRDSRIRLHRQTPLGLVAALNKGLALARGKYIARMDADDIMLAHRLQVQLEFLIRYPNVHLVGTQAEVFPADNLKVGYREYIRWQNNCLTHRDIVDELYVESPLAHPTVMVHRDVFSKLGGYRDGDFPEDYDLWLRMAREGMQFGKIPQVLLKWRDNSNRTSRIDGRYRRENFDRLRAEYLAADPRIHSTRPLVVWGAGRKTRKRVQRLGIAPALWVDVDRNKIGNRYMDAKVVNYTCLRDMAGTPDKPYVLSYVTNYGARDLIARELQASGFNRGDDYLMVG